MTELVAAIGHTLTPLPFFYVALGTFLGILVGAIPGLTGGMLIALTLPLTFYMSSEDALTLLVAMYVGGVTGGLISATLLRMPGTPASVMTTLDGYPMARAGRPGEAIGWGVIASFVGGMVSWLFLAVVSEPLARIGLRLGNFDYFAMVVTALVLIAAVSQGSLIKGLISGLLGMLVAMPGVDPINGTLRLTFGYHALAGGLNLLPVLVGLFAGSQVISDIVSMDQPREPITFSGRGMFISLRDLGRQAGNFLRSSLIGTWIGILPGIGANVGSVVAYTLAKSVSRTPERFGRGAVEGIVASETANNATVGGALIPLLALGIPGSVVDAILLGALTIHNVQPGPMLFRSNPDIVYAVIASCLVANVVMLIMMTGLTGFIARLTIVPRSYLLPVILVFCVLGTFAFDNRWFDVGVMLVFSAIGFGLERVGVPLGPFVIGVVLAPIAERSFRAGMMATAGDILPMFQRPVTDFFLLLALVTLVWTISRERRQSQRGATNAEGFSE